MSTSPSESPQQSVCRPVYAGFWFRFLAHLIDHSALSILSIISGLMFLGIDFWYFRITQGVDLDWMKLLDPTVLQIGVAAIYLTLALFYYSGCLYKFGATLGKIPFRLRVVDAETFAPITLRQAFIRCVGYFFSWIFLLGYLAAAIHPRKRALHDWMARTVVIVKPILGVVALLSGGLLLSSSGFAQEENSFAKKLSAEVQGTWVHDSFRGGTWKGAAAALYTDRDFSPLSLGPRVGVDDTGLFLGAQATLWLVNAFGLGVGVDGGAGHFRIEPSLSARFLHFGGSGAWAAKIGGEYDSVTHFGFQLGLTLELSGVPHLGGQGGE